MALTKIGATLGGSADVITVTQSSHGLYLGYPVKMTSSGYAHATANTAANAEAVGIVIATDRTGANTTFSLALGGRVTVDGCVPNLATGTVLFLQVSAGLLAAAEPSGNTQVSKPMAVITIANSEMIMVQQRGEVISTAGITLADGSVDNDAMADNAIDTDEIADDAVTYVKMQNIGTANRVLGRTSTGEIQEVQISSAMIAADQVTYNIMQDTAADNKVLGATTAGTIGEVSIETAMIAANAVDLAAMQHGTQGDVLYYGASGVPIRLGYGTSGLFLKTQGSGANPVWAAAAPAFTGIEVSIGSDAGISRDTSTALTWTQAMHDIVAGTAGSTQWNSSSNQTRIVCKSAGRYYIYGVVAWQASNNNGALELKIKHEGNVLAVHNENGNSESQRLYQRASKVYNLAVDDYLELFVLQDTSSNRACQYLINNSIIDAPTFGMYKIA